MARPSLALLDTLRLLAKRLEESSYYQWGHMGSCNCGFLAQLVTNLSRQEIHRRAMMGTGDWTEQLNDYCPSSGLPMTEMIDALISTGFDVSDLQHLERLSDPEILSELPEGRTLQFNVKDDVIEYLRTWANLLEAHLLDPIKLPEFEAPFFTAPTVSG